MNYKRLVLKIACIIISMIIIRVKDFAYINNLLYQKSNKNVLIYGVLYKIFIGAKRLRIMFSKVDELIRHYSGNKYLALFGSENIVPFSVELNIL